ncbi:SpoIID/LytB domain-containing protein [Citricoccus nitrophenolicus]|uniref:SpoIID/LytB domain-containing protein n=1 Tax=Citricoccus nitrophenolicus TaxID=863575 RepID=UPI0031E99052
MLSLVLTSVLVLSSGAALAAPARAATEEFRDVPPGSTYYEPVTWMVQAGITTGRSGGSIFGVRDNLNRAEAAAFLHRLVDPDFMPPDSSGFPDVSDPDNWDYAPITWLVHEGVVSGYADGTFKPLRHITRGELAKILYGVADPAYPAPSSAPFADVQVGSTYHRHISWLKYIGATHGYADGTYRPSQHINRGETAQLIRAVAEELGYDTSVVPDSFTVQGSGWGHGAGMSQYGARAMAAGGRTAEQILQYYYTGVQVSSSSHRAYENLRVHLLSTASTTLKATKLNGTDGYVRVRTAGSVLPTTGAVRLEADGGDVVTTMPDGTRKRAGSAILEWPGTRFWNADSPNAATLRVPNADGGTRPLDLRHGKVIVTVIGGRLNIVTELRMNDEYLYGLAEMPSSWPAAALQAQAIAGRSYALRNMGSLKADCGCHVWDEVRSQKFTGWAKESEGTGAVYGKRWTAAVDGTLSRNTAGTPVRAKSLWYNGGIVDAVYFSSSGGHTRSAVDVWGNAVPYLQGRPDPYSLSADAHNPNASWTQSVSQATMASAFGLPSVVSVRFTLDGADSARYVSATAADGTTSQITGNQFRSRVGAKSTWLSAVTPR